MGKMAIEEKSRQNAENKQTFGLMGKIEIERKISSMVCYWKTMLWL